MTELSTAEPSQAPAGRVGTLSATCAQRDSFADNRTQIQGMAAAVPDHLYTQKELCHLLGYGDHRIARGIFENTAIDQRYLSVTPEELVRPRAARDQVDVIGRMLPLAEQAIRRLLDQTGLPPSEVGAFVFNTSSGFLMPAPSAVLAARLNFRPETVRYDLTSAGCLGALPVLSLAGDYVKANPTKRVVAVCVDLGSVGLHPTDGEDKEAVVVNAIFGDGAVAMLLGAGGRSHNNPEVVDIQYLQGHSSLLDSAYMATDAAGLLTAHIHKDLPSRSATLLQSALATLLRANHLTLEQVSHWAFHPGGRAILDRLQSDLGLSDVQMAPSRTALRQFGNVGSPTCLMALQDLMAEQRPSSGEYGILAAIGPGLAVGLALLRWP